jgi:hypothetical protein
VTHQAAGLVTDPVGLGYSYPPPDCAGVLDDDHFLLVVEHTDSVMSSVVHSDYPGSFHVSLHKHTNVTVSYFTMIVVSDIANL